MKKKSKTFLLLIIYSFVSLSVFAKEVTVCVSHDHIGLKVFESKCCDETHDEDFSVPKASNNCPECHDFTILFSSVQEHNVNHGTDSLDNSNLKEIAPFTPKHFVDIRNTPENQLRSSKISKDGLSGPEPLLLALRTVSLQL